MARLTLRKHKCKSCEKVVKPKLKLGAILCSNCSRVLFFPDHDLYLEVYEEIKKQYKRPGMRK
jgi:ribosomal protein L37AE/L43A